MTDPVGMSLIWVSILMCGHHTLIRFPQKNLFFIIYLFPDLGKMTNFSLCKKMMKMLLLEDAQQSSPLRHMFSFCNI